MMHFNHQFHQWNAKLFHRQQASPLPNAQAGHFNHEVAAQLNYRPQSKQQWVDFINGKVLPNGCDPVAMVYAGHQFGHWAGQLGDGRGLLIGQVMDTSGKLTDLHLKGIGKTPYSRMGDGRAVLRSTIREYLAGHALAHLHVPTSNALGFVYSHDLKVQREKLEPTAILLRTSDCHIRLGHFEWIRHYQPDLLTDFTQHCLQTYYPQCLKHSQPYLEFAKCVIDRTAYLIAQWQLVGFAHGVMNTDNLNITGSTLDFGPYGFMERFRPQWINNHSDHQGRYCYQNQPSIAHWNLWVWLQQLIPLADSANQTEFQQQLLHCLEHYETAFLHYYQAGLCKKMGLPLQHATSFDCGLQFLTILKMEQFDYTTAFQWLTQHHYQQLKQHALDTHSVDHFLQQYQKIRNKETDIDTDILDLDMRQHNPVYILRNHMAQHAIERAEQDDLSEVDRLFKLLSQPFNLQKELQRETDLHPLDKNQAEICVSCSS